MAPSQDIPSWNSQGSTGGSWGGSCRGVGGGHGLAGTPRVLVTLGIGDPDVQVGVPVVLPARGAEGLVRDGNGPARPGPAQAGGRAPPTPGKGDCIPRTGVSPAPAHPCPILYLLPCLPISFPSPFPALSLVLHSLSFPFPLAFPSPSPFPALFPPHSFPSLPPPLPCHFPSPPYFHLLPFLISILLPLPDR